MNNKYIEYNKILEQLKIDKKKYLILRKKES